MKHILKRSKISKLSGGDSEETFLVEYGRDKFVLRVYETIKEADYNSLIHSKLKKYGFLPKLFYQEKNKLLFEYIEGRDCKKSDALKVAEQVGKICARINQLKIKGSKYAEKNIVSCLQLLKDYRFINEKQKEFLEKKYFELKKKSKPKISMDFDDIYPENFRLRDGKVYLVDFEGFEPKIKGRGIGKGFLRWFRTPAQRKRFKKGYSSVTSSRFLTEDYLQFLYLCFTIFIIVYKIKSTMRHPDIRKKKEINPSDLQRLKKFIEGKRI